MARKLPTDMGKFNRRYSSYVESDIEPSRERLEQLLKDMGHAKYWRKRVRKIYSARRGRSDPAKHPVPSPVHHTKTRVKFADSVARKLQSEPAYGGFSRDAMANLEDVLGARIIVYFPHQLTWIDEDLRESKGLEIRQDPKPKSFHDEQTLLRLGLNPHQFDARARKVSGYSSLHYVARFSERELKPGEPRPWFEIQVRTIAEELWGEIEHHIGYKPDTRTAFSVQRQFRVISDHLQAVDMHLDFIYDEMQHFQNTATEPASDDLLNAENLPVVLSKLQIQVEQQEIGSITDLLRIFGISTVGDLQNRATYRCLERVRGAWKRHLGAGEEPTALMIVNVVVALAEDPDDQQIELLVVSYVDVYRALRMRE